MDNLFNKNDLLKPMNSIHIAPIMKETNNETIFKGYGHSHISHVKNEGFHITTQIPGIPGGSSIHDKVNDFFKR